MLQHGQVAAAQAGELAVREAQGGEAGAVEHGPRDAAAGQAQLLQHLKLGIRIKRLKKVVGARVKRQRFCSTGSSVLGLRIQYPGKALVKVGDW